MEQTRITPDRITSLKDSEIFVFGSNALGHHASGAAKVLSRNLAQCGDKGMGCKA